MFLTVAVWLTAATHSTSLGQGLDQEMPGAAFMNAEKVSAQLASGAISQAQIDDSVLRMLSAGPPQGVLTGLW